MGKVDVGNHLDYEARATMEMLRGNLDDAQQRWAELHRLPPRPLAFQVKGEPQEVELHLWRAAPVIAFRRGRQGTGDHCGDRTAAMIRSAAEHRR